MQDHAVLCGSCRGANKIYICEVNNRLWGLEAHEAYRDILVNTEELENISEIENKKNNNELYVVIQIFGKIDEASSTNCF